MSPDGAAREAVTIGPAIPGDVPLVLAFIRELAEYERLAHEVVATEADLHDALFGERPAAGVLIARVDGEPAGFALFFTTFSTFVGRPGIWLEDLFVRPAFRGRGIGRRLLVELARRVVARRGGRLEWNVLDWNAPAIRLYESLGARPMDEWTTYRLDGAALETLAAEPRGTPPAEGA
jgi:GNAT superfamily N-acetyltransferase